MMVKKTTIVFLMLMAGFSLYASDLNGIWNLVFYDDGDAHSEVISLKIEGTKVSGKWWEDEISGTIKGDKIRLDFWRGDSRDPVNKEKTKHSILEAKIYDRKVMMGTIETTGTSNWGGPVLLTRARMNSEGGTPILHDWDNNPTPVDSELNGSWNIHIYLDAESQHMYGEIWPLVFHLKVVDGTRVKGFVWDQHVDGTFADGELILKFPYWNQVFTDDFSLQAKVENGKVSGTWQHGLMYGRCKGKKAEY